MPLISIKMASPIPEQDKLELVAKKITEIMVNDLGKDPSRVIVDFTEVSSDAVFFGARSVASLKKDK